ncbi:MAG: DUF1826 domain-containing protein [Pseudomonadota bacterium]
MTYVRETIENAAVGVAVLSDPQAFGLFTKQGIAAAIWQREVPEDFQTWIDKLPVTNLPAARVTTRIDVLRDTIESIFADAEIAQTVQGKYLIDDTVMLAQNFSTLMGVQQLRLRFDVIENDACRKFHIDAVSARLICTYRGTGTQYGISTDGSEPKRIFSVPTGAPMVLRGTKWPEPPASGLLHRSPPIEGTGMTRLVFVVDSIADDFDDAFDVRRI